MDAITAETSLAPLEIPRLADANDPPYRAGPRGLRMRRRRHPALRHGSAQICRSVAKRPLVLLRLCAEPPAGK